MTSTHIHKLHTNTYVWWVVCRDVEVEAWRHEYKMCQTGAVQGEAARKAEQRTNLKADVADRSEADLSNVWVLACQVLHLQSHRGSLD